MAAVLPLPDERDRAIKGRRARGEPKIDEGGELPDVEEQPDGGALVTEKKDAKAGSGEFDANLADGEMEEPELMALAHDLLRKIDHDKQARSNRDKQYEEGLKRTGLGEDAPGGATFTGASKVTHPMLTEACVDFAASAMKELFPPSGPVRTEIIGEQTPEQLKIGERQFKYMNWQLTEQIEEYGEELSVTMTQLPMGGSQYMKLWPDQTEGRPRCEFVPIDDLLVPYACTSFWSAHRITHVQRLTESEFEDRVESEMYRDLALAPSSQTPESTRAGKASEKIEGVEEPPENLDGIRIVYEVSCFCKIKKDKEERLPYLVTIDERTNRILAVYRNWEKDDRRRKRLHWIVDFGFIPWRGAYKLGLAQMIGGLSAAATGALRALLDSALVQTIPVLAKMKGVKFGGQSKQIDPMTMIDIEAGTGMDDIRKALMALPFNPPSPVLYALIGWLTDAAKGVVTTAEEKIADAGNNMPVGTSLALIEQGAKVFSAIHAGLHRSQRKLLKILARLNKYGVDKEAQIEKFGEIICTEQDFARPLGVIPVSDPNIFSEGQRYAQTQMVIGYAQGVDPKTGQPTATGALHNLYECLHWAYSIAKIPNIDTILPPPKQPAELNAAAENSAVMLGNPIMAFPEQEHLAHLETHMRFIIDPLLGGNPAAVPQSWPRMIEHIKQHLSFLYAKTMHDIATKAVGQDIAQLMKDKKNWNKVDEVLAAASRIVHDRLSHILKPLGPEINRMIQQIEAMKPPQPMDPSQAALAVAKMEDQRGQKKDQTEAQLSAAELAEKKKKDDDAAAIAADKNRIVEEENLRKHGRETDAMNVDAAHRGHEQAMDLAGHHRDAAAAEHQQNLDMADRSLQVAGQAHDQSMQAADQHLKHGGQAHEHLMSEAEHTARVQQEEHTRRMAEAEHTENQRQHDDQVRQEEARRRDEAARAEAELKARAKQEKKDGKV